VTLSAIRILRVPPSLRSQPLAAAPTVAMPGGALALALIGRLIRPAGLTVVFGLIAAISTAGPSPFAVAVVAQTHPRRQAATRVCDAAEGP
jgi:hypothetical protein